MDDAGRAILTPARRRYTLDELLARCKPKARVDRQDREWLAMKPVGREIS
jgi:antitoxin ChpS